ncbi:DUF1097 domain-containing protein [Salimicrobium halophilum]|uniref:DUF1097 domain-containing protein n=1 Tax=Salimicrobium halophilum TaxID=86666 RepID=A0A1G8UXE7_9BACI|nr:DUF1097 domain-containing protein [Salimicrobium halophilum]SDJ57765.1 Protein of unknown function [Salimicrobium halophilum]
MAAALATGLLSGIWTYIAPFFGMLIWAGFAGCTTFFAVGTGRFRALATASITNITGVACGMMILLLSTTTEFSGGMAIFSGIVTTVMVLLGTVKPTNYTPGIFVGAFSTFASGGDWLIVAISLLAGVLLGFFSAELGMQFSKLHHKFAPKRFNKAQKTFIEGEENNTEIVK